MNKNLIINSFYEAILSFSVLFFSFYFYEISNYASFLLFGMHPIISWSGLIPTMVSSTMASSISASGILLKPVQTLFSVVAIFIFYFVAERLGLRYSAYLAIGVISLFITSFYWESFYLLSYIPLWLHEAIYILITVALMVLLIKLKERGKATEK